MLRIIALRKFITFICTVQISIFFSLLIYFHFQTFDASVRCSAMINTVVAVATSVITRRLCLSRVIDTIVA